MIMDEIIYGALHNNNASTNQITPEIRVSIYLLLAEHNPDM